jgi:hypothetical protein
MESLIDMENLRAYLLSDKNFSMLESIIPEKIFSVTGTRLPKDDTFFQQNLMMIAMTVTRDEIKEVKVYDTSSVIKINNIIITECVKYISSLLQQQEEEQLSSKLEDIEEDIAMESLPVKKEETVVIPKLKETLLIFEKYNTSAKLKNIVSAEISYVSVDFSDYLVTENNCCFCINNDEKQVPIGNYTPTGLVESLSQISGLSFQIDSVTEKIKITQQTSNKKSLTGSIKESQTQYNIDFGVKNSICGMIGFSPVMYTLKETPIFSEFKHSINFPQDIAIDVSMGTYKLSIRIPTVTEYNKTIHFTPKVSEKVTINGEDIDDVIVDTNGYNFRNRPFKIAILFNFC